MKKFKILHVVMAKVWGGGEQYVYDVSKEMQRQGHSVFVLVDKSNCLLQQRYAEVATVVTANLYCAAGLFSVSGFGMFLRRWIGLCMLLICILMYCSS